MERWEQHSLIWRLISFILAFVVAYLLFIADEHDNLNPRIGIGYPTSQSNAAAFF
ncbi:hypothetical protein XIS1_1250022 [Xenorhabdus innexi]|uniref:Uncharacterized protein n=1 Tax=Xenorhabdus innexi TaxID=290109 RepID=A0A1N6MSA3_9GAMM|nr:hypothetical protein XIS1_1250022 [Xenorhabdus innexi]